MLEEIDEKGEPTINKRHAVPAQIGTRWSPAAGHHSDGRGLATSNKQRVKHF
jgi:hypothetical protein